ncbi:hypothetical protein [Marimonas arenosa]|uniref:Uncharacterized protein n=1 Tax=Marimonas arenosa TaxID=1795305 RepID=A0AAE4B4E1_9RHOB|nr:hypothetical protein [Marimonas arenosa]MDQ2090140.1 hypothetical protein [Marimonas arenosa]
MTHITQESLRAILGEVDAKIIAAVQATGASMKDVEEAKAIADGRSDIVGSGEQALSGPLKQVLTILGGAPDDD